MIMVVINDDGDDYGGDVYDGSGDDNGGDQ
jgi:hypothetical protein